MPKSLNNCIESIMAPWDNFVQRFRRPYRKIEGQDEIPLNGVVSGPSRSFRGRKSNKGFVIFATNEDPILLQPGQTVKDVCKEAARRANISNCLLELFSLVSEDGQHVLNVHNKITPDQCQQTYYFQVVFKPCHASQLREFDIKTLQYYYHQNHKTFIDDGRLPEFEEEKQKYFVMMVLTEITRIANDNEVKLLKVVEKSGSFGLKNLLNKGLFKEYSTKEVQKYLKENLSSYEILSDTDRMANFLHAVEQSKDFFIHKFTVYKHYSRPGTAIPAQKEFVLLISAEGGIKKKDDDVEDNIVKEFSEILSVSLKHDENRVCIARNDECPEILIAKTVQDAQTIVTLIEGYYRLLVNRYKNLVGDSRVPRIHGPIRRKEAESLLQALGKEDGLFLVREKRDIIGAFALSLYHDNGIKHYEITCENGKYMLLNTNIKNEFDKIESLVDHYKQNKDGLPVCLGKRCTPDSAGYSALFSYHPIVPTSERPQKINAYLFEEVNQHQLRNQGRFDQEGEFGVVHHGYWVPRETEIVTRKLRKINDFTKDFFDVGDKLVNLKNQNVVRFYGMAKLRQEIALIFEHIPMGPLDEYLRRQCRRPSGVSKYRVMLFASQIAEGMMFLKTKDCVHGRLSAHNVLVSSEECVKISDVGLLDFASHGGIFLPQKSQFKSTSYCWQAPEVLVKSTGQTEFTHESDVWSLGVTIWEMFTQRRPFHFTSSNRVLERDQILKRYLKRQHLNTNRPNIPEGVSELLHRCWESFEDRRVSFDEIRSTLRSLAEKDVSLDQEGRCLLLPDDVTELEDWEQEITRLHEARKSQEQPDIQMLSDGNYHGINSPAADSTSDQCESCLTGPHPHTTEHLSLHPSLVIAGKQNLYRTLSDPGSPPGMEENDMVPFENPVAPRKISLSRTTSFPNVTRTRRTSSQSSGGGYVRMLNNIEMTVIPSRYAKATLEERHLQMPPGSPTPHQAPINQDGILESDTRTSALEGNDLDGQYGQIDGQGRVDHGGVACDSAHAESSAQTTGNTINSESLALDLQDLARFVHGNSNEPSNNQSENEFVDFNEPRLQDDTPINGLPVNFHNDFTSYVDSEVKPPSAAANISSENSSLVNLDGVDSQMKNESTEHFSLAALEELRLLAGESIDYSSVEQPEDSAAKNVLEENGFFSEESEDPAILFLGDLTVKSASTLHTKNIQESSAVGRREETEEPLDDAVQAMGFLSNLSSERPDLASSNSEKIGVASESDYVKAEEVNSYVDPSGLDSQTEMTGDAMGNLSEDRDKGATDLIKLPSEAEQHTRTLPGIDEDVNDYDYKDASEEDNSKHMYTEQQTSVEDDFEEEAGGMSEEGMFDFLSSHCVANASKEVTGMQTKQQTKEIKDSPKSDQAADTEENTARSNQEPPESLATAGRGPGSQIENVMDLESLQKLCSSNAEDEMQFEAVEPNENQGYPIEDGSDEDKCQETSTGAAEDPFTGYIPLPLGSESVVEDADSGTTSALAEDALPSGDVPHPGATSTVEKNASPSDVRLAESVLASGYLPHEEVACKKTEMGGPSGYMDHPVASTSSRTEGASQASSSRFMEDAPPPSSLHPPANLPLWDGQSAVESTTSNLLASTPTEEDVDGTNDIEMQALARMADNTSPSKEAGSTQAQPSLAPAVAPSAAGATLPETHGMDATALEQLKQKIPDELRLDPKNIKMCEQIGQGNFGVVRKATLRRLRNNGVKTEHVAVKVLKPNGDPRDVEDFIREAENMIKIANIRSSYIIKLIGISFGSEDDAESAIGIMIVTEFAPYFDLPKYLKKQKDFLSTASLLDFCLQIAKGMACLEKNGFVHRDLAARNILVVKEGLVKISDFGMSRLDTYYKARPGKWPLKWYAPESLRERKFTPRSDMWSFGVTMWEIFSFGARPYPDIEPTQILSHIEKGVRLPCPDVCPKEIYEVMRKCWSEEPMLRETFFMLTEDKIPRLQQKYPLPE